VCFTVSSYPHGLQNVLWPQRENPDNFVLIILVVEALSWNYGCGILVVESWLWNPGFGILQASGSSLGTSLKAAVAWGGHGMLWATKSSKWCWIIANEEMTISLAFLRGRRHDCTLLQELNSGAYHGMGVAPATGSLDNPPGTLSDSTSWVINCKHIWSDAALRSHANAKQMRNTCGLHVLGALKCNTCETHTHLHECETYVTYTSGTFVAFDVQLLNPISLWIGFKLSPSIVCDFDVVLKLPKSHKSELHQEPMTTNTTTSICCSTRQRQTYDDSSKYKALPTELRRKCEDRKMTCFIWAFLVRSLTPTPLHTRYVNGAHGDPWVPWAAWGPWAPWAHGTHGAHGVPWAHGAHGGPWAPWAPWAPMGPHGPPWAPVLHNGPGINPLHRNKRETAIYTMFE